MDRFQKYMERLATFDFERFKETIEDLRYFEAKTGRKQDEHSVSFNFQLREIELLVIF